MKLIEIFLTEDKKNILINKLGFHNADALWIEYYCKSLSIWMGNKIIDHLKLTKSDNEVKKMLWLGIINSNSGIHLFRGEIHSIMDWIRIGLHGNILDVKNLTLNQLFDASEDWHESLSIDNDDDINYKETHPIVIDFRSPDGNGFYWVDLKSTYCPEEAKRMGHCASSNGKLYSLRSETKIEEGYFTNRSHITASVTHNGKLLQMKGPKNSKPNPIYHKYIVPFIIKFVNTIGVEYNPKNDFKINDLSDEEFNMLHQQKPYLITDFFNRQAGGEKFIDVDPFNYYAPNIALAILKTSESFVLGNPYTFINKKGETDITGINPYHIINEKAAAAYFNIITKTNDFKTAYIEYHHKDKYIRVSLNNFRPHQYKIKTDDLGRNVYLPAIYANENGELFDVDGNKLNFENGKVTKVDKSPTLSEISQIVKKYL